RYVTQFPGLAPMHGSIAAPVRPRPTGFPGPRHRTAFVRAVPRSVRLPGHGGAPLRLHLACGLLLSLANTAASIAPGSTTPRITFVMALSNDIPPNAIQRGSPLSIHARWHA